MHGTLQSILLWILNFHSFSSFGFKLWITTMLGIKLLDLLLHDSFGTVGITFLIVVIASSTTFLWPFTTSFSATLILLSGQDFSSCLNVICSSDSWHLLSLNSICHRIDHGNLCNIGSPTSLILHQSVLSYLICGSLLGEYDQIFLVFIKLAIEI